MKNNNLALTIIALVIVLILGGLLAFGYYQKATYKLQRPVVTMEIENFGTVKMELYPDEAPNTVRNFIKLINEGYYNGLTFHRVEEDLIQGGDKQGDGSGETEVSINGEFSENDYDNTLKFERGTLGLARHDYTLYAYYYGLGDEIVREGYNSGYAQFFIMTKEEENFNGYYTAFGKVIEGIEIVDEITKLETEVETDEETGEETATTKPVNPPVITKISVDTFGKDYGEPETHETFDINTYIMQKMGVSY